MDNPEYIDGYFKKQFAEEESRRFEKRILEDEDFAEQVAFYIATNQAAALGVAEDKKKWFKEIYDKNKPYNSISKPVRKLWPAIAAAAVLIGLAIGFYVWMQTTSPGQMADKYMQQNLQTLGVTMSSKLDSMQTGIQLYNEKKFPEALAVFNALIKSDTSNYVAKKNAGIVYLNTGDYDKSIILFTELENVKGLYTNPGKFYHALALMKRNRAGDKDLARQLLKEVVQQDLTGKQEAEKWLLKW